MTGHPRSRWLFLALSLLTAAVCVSLGLWQLGRYSTKHSANGLAKVTRQNPPTTLPGSGYPAPDVPVIVRGTYDFEHELVLRGRAHDGAPGVEIVTPLRVPGSDSAYLVVRGFVPSDDAISVDLAPLREPGERTVRGVFFRVPSSDDGGAPLERRGARTWARLDPFALRDIPYPVSGYAIWQEKDSTTTGLPIRLGAPALSDGPHLNYALQWFAFALIFAGGGIAYTFRKREEGTQIIPGVSPVPSAPTPTSGGS